jgi:asparagine synthetase B (glutamine-hydrolysing)
MAHWGKEVRFPYLDEGLVRWAIETPAWEKCDFGTVDDESGIEPGKRILRLLALRLGLSQVAREKKRAVSLSPFHDSSTPRLHYTKSSHSDSIWFQNSEDGE